MNPVQIVALEAPDLLVVVGNESDTLSRVDKGGRGLPFNIARLPVQLANAKLKE